MIISKVDSPQNLRAKKRLRNALGCDLLVDFFYAAVSSNNAEFLCDPFPKAFLKNIQYDETASPSLRYRKKNLKDIKHVKSLLDNMDKINRIENPEDDTLLNWIINSEVQLKRVLKVVIKDDELINDNDSMEDLTLPKFGNLDSSSLYLSSESLDMEDNDLHDYVPTYIFKVNYRNCSVDGGEDKVPRCIQHNQEFEKLKKEYGSFYGYHGSSFENFHSILHYGLQNNLNKRSAFGHGIYTSTDLKVSFTFSKGNAGRGKKSIIGKGGQITVVALCEIIKHPDIINKEESTIKLIIKDEAPDGYFVIKNNAHIRVTHLLVYADKKKTFQSNNKFMSFIHNHFIVILFILYFLLMYYLGHRSTE